MNKFFADTGIKKFSISGEMGGILPLQRKDDKIYIKDGLLQSQEGGIVRLDESISNGLFPGSSKQMQKIRKALKNYHYEFFELRLDGKLSGAVMMTLSARGRNPDMKNKKPVELKLQIETELSLLFKPLLKNK